MRYGRKTALVTAAGVATASLLALSACGGSGASSGSGGGGTSKAGNASNTPTLQFDVLTGKLSTKFNIMGPDGKGHDTFVPEELTVKAGQTYKVVVYNYDEGAHSFTIDSLGINETIAPDPNEDQPSVTTFTLTFPKTGTFRFYCKLPCDAGQGGWAMTKDSKGAGPSQDAFMAGYVNVISG